MGRLYGKLVYKMGHFLHTLQVFGAVFELFESRTGFKINIAIQMFLSNLYVPEIRQFH